MVSPREPSGSGPGAPKGARILANFLARLPPRPLCGGSHRGRRGRAPAGARPKAGASARAHSFRARLGRRAPVGASRRARPGGRFGGYGPAGAPRGRAPGWARLGGGRWRACFFLFVALRPVAGKGATIGGAKKRNSCFHLFFISCPFQETKKSLETVLRSRRRARIQVCLSGEFFRTLGLLGFCGAPKGPGGLSPCGVPTPRH